MMLSRPLGATGLNVSALGLGAGALGDERLSDSDAEALLRTSLDLGITLIDTAVSYGVSEQRIGRFLTPALRERVVLSTKGGYSAAGAPDWTPEAIALGIEQALVRLRTDRLDIFHFHSCPLEVARRDDLLEALARARTAGKIRVAAYSGENEALAWAVACGHFGSVQCSVNLFDQKPGVDFAQVGVLAKRSIGNAPWRFVERPAGDYAETYWERMKAMQLDPSPLGWDELAIRFAAFAPGVSCALLGTSSPAHLMTAARSVEGGPLNPETLARVRARFDPRWPGQV